MGFSEAIYDTLFIGLNMQESQGDFTESEIQLLSYLACLLSLFDGKNISFWNYSYIKNENGGPSSYQISKAIGEMKLSGHISEETKTFFQLTNIGVEFLKNTDGHFMNSQRKKYLYSVCIILNLMPYGNLLASINEEPLLKYSRQHNLRRDLLDEYGAMDLLYDQFEALKGVLASHSPDDLVTPGYTWLSSQSYFKEA